jgi:hypothetical protein
MDVEREQSRLNVSRPMSDASEADAIQGIDGLEYPIRNEWRIGARPSVQRTISLRGPSRVIGVTRIDVSWHLHTIGKYQFAIQ